MFHFEFWLEALKFVVIKKYCYKSTVGLDYWLRNGFARAFSVRYWSNLILSDSVLEYGKYLTPVTCTLFITTEN